MKQNGESINSFDVKRGIPAIRKLDFIWWLTPCWRHCNSFLYVCRRVLKWSCRLLLRCSIFILAFLKFDCQTNMRFGIQFTLKTLEWNNALLFRFHSYATLVGIIVRDDSSHHDNGVDATHQQNRFDFKRSNVRRQEKKIVCHQFKWWQIYRLLNQVA